MDLSSIESDKRLYAELIHENIVEAEQKQFKIDGKRHSGVGIGVIRSESWKS